MEEQQEPAQELVQESAVELEPIELAPAGKRRSRARTIGRVVLVVALVNLVAGGTWLATRGDEDVDADRALARAAAIMNDTDSFRATVTSRSASSPLEEGEAGSEQLTVTKIELTVAGDDRWHSVTDAGDWFDESLRVGSKLYTRWGESESEATDAQWDELPWSDVDEELTVEDMAEMYESMEDMEEFADESGGMAMGFGPQIALEGFFLDAGGDPMQIKDLVTGAENPVVENREGGGIVLRATVPADPRLAEAVGDLPDVVVVIHLDADDTPTRIVASSEEDAATEQIDIALRDFGAAIEVEPPAKGDVDPTPWVEEEDLLAAKDITPIVPTDPPDGFVLQTASVENDLEIATYGCRELWLEYGEPMPEDFDPALFEEDGFEDLGYISLMVVPLSCAVEQDATAFDETTGGRPSRSDGYYALEVQVGDMAVLVDTTLDGDALEALVAGLEPTTMQALIDAVDDVAGAEWFSEY